MAKAKECQKVAKVHCKAEEEAVVVCLRVKEETKCKAAEEAVKKRVSALTFPKKWCCYASQQTYVEVKVLTLREVLMKRHCVLKARQELEQETRGLGHNLDKLQICKIDVVIV